MRLPQLSHLSDGLSEGLELGLEDAAMLGDVVGKEEGLKRRELKDLAE